MGRFHVVFWKISDAASSVFLSNTAYGRTGRVFLRAFSSGFIKKVPKKGEHAAMQASDTLVFFSIIQSLVSDFVCHAVMACFTILS